MRHTLPLPPPLAEIAHANPLKPKDRDSPQQIHDNEDQG
jgi:hypothetical protein